MIIRKSKGFRLGRTLVRIWKGVFRRRPRNRRHLNLVSHPSSCSKSTTAAVASKLIDWGKCLTRCLTRRRKRASVAGGGAYRRLEDVEIEDKMGGSGGVRKPPPKGHLTVYVGDEKELAGGGTKRYVVPVIYFNHPMFCELLREAEEEFGFQHPGAITIPCPSARFERAAAVAAAQRRSLGRS